MQVAVVGHVEWVEFARVEAMPASGDIVHATDVWAEAAGGGAVAAVQLARLAGEATLFTVLGNDELGRRAHKQCKPLTNIGIDPDWRREVLPVLVRRTVLRAIAGSSG